MIVGNQSNKVYIDGAEAFARVSKNAKACNGAFLFYYRDDDVFQVIRNTRLDNSVVQSKKKQDIQRKIDKAKKDFVGFYDRDFSESQLKEDIDRAVNSIETLEIAIFLQPINVGSKPVVGEIKFKGYRRVSAMFKNGENTDIIDLPRPPPGFEMPGVVFLAILDHEGVVLGYSIHRF